MGYKALRAERQLRGLTKRGGVFQFRKAIPQKLQKLIGKREFVQSLRTNDVEEAILRCRAAQAEFDDLIRNAREGRKPVERRSSADELAEMALVMGLDYRPASEIARHGDHAEFLRRHRLWEERGRPGGEQFKAIFGEADKIVRLSTLLDDFIHETRDERARLNSREVDKKLNPLRKAVSDLIGFTGDIHIAEVTARIAADFTQKLKDRVAAGEIKPNTANKTLGSLRKTIAFAIESQRFSGDNPFASRRLKGKVGRRPAYSIKFIRDNILAPGALSGLNDVCQALVWAMIDTGAHASELCGLDPITDIFIHEPIPYINIQPNQHRLLKNDSRPRSIPLIGLSLQAFLSFPTGFERYRRPGGPEAASTNINKFLKTSGLTEPAMLVNGSSQLQTTYSFRHTFKDRLRAHHIEEGAQNHLMGHSTPGMGSHYGRGYDLKTIRESLISLESDFLSASLTVPWA